MANYSAYADYLKSAVFLAARDIEMKSALKKCRRCGAKATEVHHKPQPDGSKGYPPWGCWETFENLEAICHECHCKEHGKPD